MSETLKPLSPGLDFSGEFEDVTLLHESGRGRLYFAVRNGKRFILKTVASDSGHDLALLKREYELSIRLSHPNIIYTYSYEPDTQLGPCIVMEYVDGTSLREYLAGKPTLKSRHRVFLQILQAVEYIHSHGIVHNDLSCENIMVCGPREDVKIIDFGFSDDAAHQFSSSIGCTRAYASPELLEGKSVDSRSDIWSLGVLTRDIFGKRYSFISRKCTKASPYERYRTIAALRSAYYRAKYAPAVLSAAVIILAAVAATFTVSRLQQETAAGFHAATADVTETTETETTAKGTVIVTTAGPNGETDLSAGGTANAYLVSHPGKYRFRADVQGCSDVPLDGKAVSATVLWESFGTMQRPQKGDLINKVRIEANWVKFSTNPQMNDGNALIAVRDSAGNILWSWHIWLCEGYSPQKNQQTYRNGAGVFMDRNLGATSSLRGEIGTMGLLYQWGRKDPFLNIGDYEGTRISYKPPVFARAESSETWPEAETLSEGTDFALYMQRHPMTFVPCSMFDDRDFVNSWKNEMKGLQDPCPPGWRVPGKNIWNLSSGIQVDTVSRPFPTEVFRGLDFGKTGDIKFSDDDDVWYPVTGTAYYRNGRNYIPTTHGFYWTAYLVDAHNAVSLYFRKPGIVKTLREYNINYGFAVRCMKDKR